MDFWGFVRWEISGHSGGVYQSHYCASDDAFLFSFVYAMHLHIATYLCGKQIKSKSGLRLAVKRSFLTGDSPIPISVFVNH